MLVLNKIATTDKPDEHFFYFNNFFTSLDFMKCPIQTGNEMEEFRGAFDYTCNEIYGIFGLVWTDNRIVKMLSNHSDALPSGRGQRWSRTEKKHLLNPKPDAIANYNKNMGGVDKLDWNIQKYRTKIRGKK
ncbi:hypothetical protein AVEN_16185-1 [Araneus ventricosus]|uniref:PiggyBac transposable element-derived protein domain-containing protein n=1 Tax=Araneus ventricosus TaxID=182803 RepID=A0A4Y2IW26_ARAVE|nr:hypothetical protein AVEN_16185-1 [Araneus ventricosus]